MTQSGHVRIGSDGRIKEMTLRAAGWESRLVENVEKGEILPPTPVCLGCLGQMP
jgi:hypothetical protein